MNVKRTARRDVLVEVKRLGGSVRINAACPQGMDIDVIAPTGFVWSASKTHTLVGVGDARGAWADIADRVSDGIGPCRGCEFCDPANLDELLGFIQVARIDPALAIRTAGEIVAERNEDASDES